MSCEASSWTENLDWETFCPDRFAPLFSRNAPGTSPDRSTVPIDSNVSTVSSVLPVLDRKDKRGGTLRDKAYSRARSKPKRCSHLSHSHLGNDTRSQIGQRSANPGCFHGGSLLTRLRTALTNLSVPERSSCLQSSTASWTRA